MRCVPAIVVLFGLLASAPAGAEVFTVVATGDAPYSVPGDLPRFERLIAAINAEQPVFTIDVGDIKSGIAPCADEALQRIRDYFDTFDGPLIYTPGDNDWLDCRRWLAGNYDPVERLGKLRAIFFTRTYSLGRAPIPLFRQGDIDPAHPDMVENARWTHAGVVFATVNVVGSSNNAGTAEFTARDAANTAWIDETFRYAADNGAPAAVIALHAQMLDSRGLAMTGFEATVAAILRGAERFGRPVLLVHGDSHRYAFDRPFPGVDGKTRIPSIQRARVLGGSDVAAIRIVIDTGAAEPFAVTPMIVEGNE